MAKLILYFLSVLFIANPLCAEESKKPHYELSVCTIFRDAGPYLKEWIEYHQLVGVEHFVLYNHLSKDNFLEVLQPYIDKKIVELYHVKEAVTSKMHWRSIQNGAYDDGLKILTGKSKWVAFIDDDEFIVPVKESNLVDVLKDFEDCSGVCPHWQLFGTSHVGKIPENGLLTENLVYRAPKNFSRNKYIKSIVRPERVRNMVTHFANYKKDFFQVDENKTHFKGCSQKKISVEKIRINHYWTRDEYFFKNFKLKYQDLRQIKTQEDYAHLMNQECDLDMLRFAPELRKRMGFNPK